MKAFAINFQTTVFVEKVKDGRWINPLLMHLVPDENGEVSKYYQMLFSEAADPFDIPALKEHAIIGEYEVPPDLEAEYRRKILEIKQMRAQMFAARAGIVQPTTSQIINIGKRKDM